MVQEDATKSGKSKRRIATSLAKPQVSVKLRLKYSEYQLFKSWYENECYYGLRAFYFPPIDEIVTDETHNIVYRFVQGQAPQFSNVGGDLVDVTMTWEKV